MALVVQRTSRLILEHMLDDDNKQTSGRRMMLKGIMETRRGLERVKMEEWMCPRDNSIFRHQSSLVFIISVPFI